MSDRITHTAVAASAHEKPAVSLLPMGQWALRYLTEHKWSVIPVKSGTKKPYLNKWAPFQNRLPTEAEVVAWWTRWPNAAVAVITGKISGIFVLDIDVKRDPGPASLAKLEGTHGVLPETVASRTGSDGEHRIFNWPGTQIKNSASTVLGPGLDCRGDGGYAILPPSRNSKGTYAWQAFLAPYDAGAVIEDAPIWLIELVKEGATRPINGNPYLAHAETVAGGPRQGLPPFLGKIHQEGSRNNALTSLIGLLLRLSINPLLVRELVHPWAQIRCSPSLPGDEVERTLESICTAELKQRRPAK